MKSVYLGLMACLCGFVLFISIAMVFQYSTAYKNLSFELRNALIQAGEEAMIPKEVCEMVACEVAREKDSSIECEEEEFVEMCEDVYMSESEFFDVLLTHLKRLKRSSGRVLVKLKAYHNPPFMAKVEVSLNLLGGFMNVPIVIEDVCLEN